MSARKKIVPIRFDDTPRFVEPAVQCDLCDTALYDALRKLRPLVQARGYNSRPIEFRDTTLICSQYYEQLSEELCKKHRGLRCQLVMPAILKGPYAWMLVFGVDAFISMGL